VIGAEVLLDDDGGRTHLEESSSMVPASNASLQHLDLLGEHAIALLFQEEILRILQEDLRLAQLIVRAVAQDGAANFRGRSLATVLKCMQQV